MSTVKKVRKGRKPAKTARIYYGTDTDGPLYWTVFVDNAKETVKIDSTVADALAGKAGVTIGCHLSKCAKRNAAAFPHAVKLASFTKETCLIVDKIKNGRPFHAWRYTHRMGKLVDLNDKDAEKWYAKSHPSLVKRKISLYQPYEYISSDRGQLRGVKKITEPAVSKKSRTPRGALARAVNAGLINAELDF